MMTCIIRFVHRGLIQQHIAIQFLRHLRYESHESRSEDDTSSPLQVTTGRSVSLLPDAPTNCCMSGCANCVWIEYALRVAEHCQESAPSVLADAIELLDDVNMKAFLRMELKLKDKY